MSSALAILSAWKALLTTIGTPPFTSSLLKCPFLRGVLLDHHLSHSFSPYPISFSSECCFFFTSGVCLLSVSHMQWELQKLRAWSVVLSPSPQHSEYYWAQQKFLSYLKKYAWLPKILRICPQHFPDSSNPQCHPGSKEMARGCCWESTLIVSELHTALHLLECWMKRHPDHTPACILPYGSLATGAPLCFLSSPGIHAIGTCSKGIYPPLYNKSPITWSEVMQTLIKANEDMGAETLFAAHSTVRGDESPSNQQFRILAPDSWRGQRSIHHLIQATPMRPQPIQQGGTDRLHRGVRQTDCKGVQINTETDIHRPTEHSAACWESQGMRAPAARCVFPITWQWLADFQPFEEPYPPDCSI